MEQPKLYDYNSSFLVLRTNPALSGNFKITIDSKGSVSLNTFDADTLLSDQKFKNFSVSGKKSLAEDLYSFFENGQTDPSLVFKVAKNTKGDIQTTKKYEEQYDHFYWSGAEVFPDKNYSEDFSYLAPLWIKSEIPDYFVVFKVPDPISYKYSENQTVIQPGLTYKVIKKYGTTDNFVISYGVNSTGQAQEYSDGQFLTGIGSYNSYNIISGEGSVCVFQELYNLDNVQDVSTYFTEKILPYAKAVKTFDLRKGTTIGDYIRGIFDTLSEGYSPINVNFANRAYSYFNGIDYRNGVYSRASEFISNFFALPDSTSQIDLENYITSGFSRNGIICPNLLNLQFLFDDEEAVDYTINRYFGAYVSRNDIGEFLLDGNYLYQLKDLPSNSIGLTSGSKNENHPKPPRNSYGYYYDNNSYVQGSTGGVMLFYQDATGFIPGSDDVNITNPYKLFYVTDKNDNFYSLKRSENYSKSSPSPSVYGSIDYSNPLAPVNFSYGVSGGTSGNIVIQDTSVDLSRFTGIDDKILSCKGLDPETNGYPSIEVNFISPIETDLDFAVRIYWPGGTRKDGSENYDVIRSGDFSGTIRWIEGSTYTSGNNYYFNSFSGSTGDIASAFRNSLYDVSKVQWSVGVESPAGTTPGSTGTNKTAVNIRANNQGYLLNSSFYVSFFTSYSNFEASYKSFWTSDKYYYIGDIVRFGTSYWEKKTSNGVSSTNPSETPALWDLYSNFSLDNSIKINGELIGPSSSYNPGFLYFKGGTTKPKTRVAFPVENSNQVIVGNWIQTNKGFSQIETISNYNDIETYDDSTGLPNGFKDYDKYLVATVSDQYDSVYYSFDGFINVYSKAKSSVGAFTFFDFKDFDFDFWSSNYGITPNYETYRYLELLPDTGNVIKPNVLYIVKQGQISYNSSTFSQGSAFFGVTGQSSFSFINQFSVKPVVFPFQFSDNTYGGTSGYGQNVGYEDDLDSFLGFLGIRSIETTTPPASDLTKIQTFEYGLLDSEYDYLKENYNVSRSNLSRIVPFICKWGYKNGTDSRGNPYRLNSSPAFSPSNFSPTFQNFTPDAKYLTHEWFLLESVPREFPSEFIKDQQSYLASKLDLSKLVSTQDSDILYLSEYFTIAPSDYSSEVRDLKDEVKELFSEFVYNEENGYYETLFKGAKIYLKKRSDSSGSTSQAGFNKYVSGYRGYDGYRYSCLLRAVTETSDTIQAPVKYRIVENAAQKFIVFLVDVVINDYKAQPLGYTGGTGGSPQVDYTLMYSLSDKKKLLNLSSGSLPYQVADIKLSSALDLSVASSSQVNTSTDPGRIYSFANPDYDTDFREEVNLFYDKSAALTTLGPSGAGSFYVNQISCVYPWPVSSSENSIEFAPVNYGSNYSFTIPFSFSSPVTVPIGPRTIYENKPVFQKSGGADYFDFILNRTSFSYVADRVNSSNSYVEYESYYTEGATGYTKNDDFEIFFETPTYFVKPGESRPVKVYSSPALSPNPGSGKAKGPATQVSSIVNSYDVTYNPFGARSELLRYSGKYEPIFRKVIHFGDDKTDQISGLTGDFSRDVRFRNCTFSPVTYDFGVIKNINYTKVSDDNILASSEGLPLGSRYPLIGQTPIARKDFNVFQSNWDPGYYNKYFNVSSEDPVAGTKAVDEFKSIMGSKIMKTPKVVIANNYITLPIYKDQGTTDVDAVNNFIDSNIVTVQSITADNSGIGIGASPIYRSAVDIKTFNQEIFPKAEIFWQKITDSKISGVIRGDRMLRRYLMNDGVGEVFFNNIISEFGVGNPASIEDDVLSYLEKNVDPIFEISTINLYVKKTGSETVEDIKIVRGDIYSGDRNRLGYLLNPNFILTKDSNLIYGFEFDFDPNFQYSLIFRVVIDKI